MTAYWSQRRDPVHSPHRGAIQATVEPVGVGTCPRCRGRKMPARRHGHRSAHHVPRARSAVGERCSGAFSSSSRSRSTVRTICQRSSDRRSPGTYSLTSYTRCLCGEAREAALSPALTSLLPTSSESSGEADRSCTTRRTRHGLQVVQFLTEAVRVPGGDSDGETTGRQMLDTMCRYGYDSPHGN